MKTKIILSVVLTIVVGLTSVLVAQNKKDSNKQTIIFNVAMDCHSCQQKIEKNIAFEKGVKAMKVSLEKQTVELTYDSRKTGVVKLQEAFEKLGYPATLKNSQSTKQ